jgi:4-hydroxy-tetrahydrodipicolinate synthase
MTTKSKNSSLHGILPALITPMNAQQEIDHEQLARFTEHLIRKGVHGLVPLGSTGEFYALTPAEREQTLKTVLAMAGGRVPVVAGVNAGAARSRRLRPAGGKARLCRRHGSRTILFVATPG